MHSQSLEKLDSGKISLMQSVDGQSAYSSTQLVNALTSLMEAYQPTEIKTQANFIGSKYPDHSDHMAVGRYVKSAYAQYEKQQFNNLATIPIEFYIGYPIHGMAANVSGQDLQAKEAAFLAYAKFDGSVCQSVQQCSNNPAYGPYLTGQYQNSY
jgi:LmbE family N-acetylglucosaminyl deacetylase